MEKFQCNSKFCHNRVHPVPVPTSVDSGQVLKDLVVGRGRIEARLVTRAIVEGVGGDHSSSVQIGREYERILLDPFHKCAVITPKL